MIRHYGNFGVKAVGRTDTDSPFVRRHHRSHINVPTEQLLKRVDYSTGTVTYHASRLIKTSDAEEKRKKFLLDRIPGGILEHANSVCGYYGSRSRVSRINSSSSLAPIGSGVPEATRQANRTFRNKWKREFSSAQNDEEKAAMLYAKAEEDMDTAFDSAKTADAVLDVVATKAGLPKNSFCNNSVETGYWAVRNYIPEHLLPDEAKFAIKHIDNLNAKHTSMSLGNIVHDLEHSRVIKTLQKNYGIIFTSPPSG